MSGRGNKYGAQRCECQQGGTLHKHDSLAERDRCFVLHCRQERGEITHLLIHAPIYPLRVNGQPITQYTPDFSYDVVVDDWRQTVYVVEDCKSPPTRKRDDYQLRRKLLRACYGIDIVEVS